MNITIKNKKLTDFFNEHKISNFAKITHRCGAGQFIDTNIIYDDNKGKHINIYKYKEDFLNYRRNNFEDTFYVLYIPNKSYLMYEINVQEIIVWVCYTEEQERKKGYITMLLKKLILINKNKKIIVDTFNKELKKICINLKQIELI